MTHFVKLISAFTLGIGLSFAAPSVTALHAAAQTPPTMKEFTATAAVQESTPGPVYPEAAIISGLLALGLSSWWLRKRKHWLDT
ncbi:hypothetical protein IQ241_23835 [Romeria aff. gracilis LEGE 07310]|uniref:PEP-CTERM protein-sorting domain-containing protein n=1 Tax=Vasconcelosia minhoensis LEGE 07310 TaxID=915328 RepID=A0A8J7ASZ6_9CYAN|nr:hypothetical protein [Romeria gracilis]MBE9080281.1 hypothetical protein [Romeria aff. gracilis LEGE 07310]